MGDEKSGCSDPDADGDWLRIIGWPGSSLVNKDWSGKIKELTKPVADSGNLLMDGEFNSPPPPPGKLKDHPIRIVVFLICDMGGDTDIQNIGWLV